MGWLFTLGATRAEIIEKCTRSWTSGEGVQYTCLTHTCRGNTLWSLWERRQRDGQVTKLIFCDLLKSSPDGYGWGYKSLQESEGPAYYSCPISYLDQAPPTNPGWREKVLAEQRRKNQKLEVGKFYTLIDASIQWVQITKLKPLQGLGSDGRMYGIPRKMLGEPMDDPEKTP